MKKTVLGGVGGGGRGHFAVRQGLALVHNTSGPVKLICSVMCFSYLLSYSEAALLFLSLTPGHLLPPSFSFWTALTYCLLEIHLWEVLVDITAVGLCAKLIEPLWGQLELLVFFAVVNLGVALLSTVFYLFLYFCTSNTDLLFKVHIHGLTGFIAGLSVAVKQIMPDHIVLRSARLGKFTNRNVPLTLTLLALFLYLVGALDGTTPVMFTSGVLVSWTYLRFYQRHSNGSRGDMADNFTFSSFFPNVIEPAISVACNTIYSVFVSVGLCRRTVRRFDLASAPTPLTVTIPGHDLHDTERRKQMALKALNERLSKGGSDHHHSHHHHHQHSKGSRGKEMVIPVPNLGPPQQPPVLPPPSLLPSSSSASPSALVQIAPVQEAGVQGAAGPEPAPDRQPPASTSVIVDVHT